MFIFQIDYYLAFLISGLGQVLLEPMAGIWCVWFIERVLFWEALQGHLNEGCRIGKGKEQNKMWLQNRMWLYLDSGKV